MFDSSCFDGDVRTIYCPPAWKKTVGPPLSPSPRTRDEADDDDDDDDEIGSNIN